MIFGTPAMIEEKIMKMAILATKIGRPLITDAYVKAYLESCCWQMWQIWEIDLMFDEIMVSWKEAMES